MVWRWPVVVAVVVLVLLFVLAITGHLHFGFSLG